jgi:hypothetical protein
LRQKVTTLFGIAKQKKKEDAQLFFVVSDVAVSGFCWVTFSFLTHVCTNTFADVSELFEFAVLPSLGIVAWGVFGFSSWRHILILKEKRENGILGWKSGECAVCLGFTVQVLDVVCVVAFVVVHPAVAVAGDVAGLESAAGCSPDPRYIRLG